MFSSNCVIVFVIVFVTLLLAVSAMNVHLVPHTHDDPGWLKTADQYYYGSNNTIYETGVQYILDTVTQQLLEDASKTFTYVEMSFFQRWYTELDDVRRSKVKWLVKEGQLSFANGGWCMHDEASTHYASMIDQTTLGHRFLNDEFGFKPRVGWQIDPFGHSKTNAWMSSAVGFDALYFGRIDYLDRDARADSQTLEFVWKGSESIPEANVFTGVFSDGNYQPPPGICFDIMCPQNQPVMDDPRLTDYNLDSMTETLIRGIEEEAAKTAGGVDKNVMLKMGSDFHYQDARMWYKNLDKLISSVMGRRSDLNLFYSTPERYTLAKAKEPVTWTTKTDDFFPYRDCDSCNWAGYFTSRPGVKRFERYTAGLNQVVKQMSARLLMKKDDESEDTMSPDRLKNVYKQAQKTMLKLGAANGVVNHHDAVTGTARQHVTDDWMQTLDSSAAMGEAFVGQMLVGNAASHSMTSPPALQTCRYANESVCAPTVSLSAGQSVDIVVYNPLPRSQSQQVFVLLGTAAADISVKDTVTGRALIAQILPVAGDSKASTIDRSGATKASARAVFTAEDVPPLGTRIFRLSLTATAVPSAASVCVDVGTGSGDVSISSDQVSVTFDSSTGLMKTIARPADDADPELWRMSDRRTHSLRDFQAGGGVSVDITQDLSFYRAWQNPPDAPAEMDPRDPHKQNLEPPSFSHGKGYVNSDGTVKESLSTQPSGAYIFRTQESDETATPIRNSDGSTVRLCAVRGELVSEMHQVFSDWATAIVRVRKGSPLVEVEWTVGEVPVSDGIGKEIIATIDASATLTNTQGRVMTDSNAREFMPRMRDMETAEFVAGNYYPLSTSAYVTDEDVGVQMSVLVDRGEGVASLKDGAMELLLHRRLLQDDYRGVSEPLNETTGGVTPYPDWVREGKGITVSGSYHVLVSPVETGISELRGAMDTQFLPLLQLYSLEGEVAPKTMPSMLSGELPVNVHLLTLEAWSPHTLLLRLSHQYAVGEDATMSAAVRVDVGALLSAFEVKGMTEMSLSANMELTEMQKRKIHWNFDDADTDRRLPTSNTDSDNESGPLVVYMKPMEIKTFLVDVSVVSM